MCPQVIGSVLCMTHHEGTPQEFQDHRQGRRPVTTKFAGMWKISHRPRKKRAESRLQDLASLAFRLAEVVTLMPPKTPRGQELTWAQHGANQALNHGRLRIAPATSSIRRCRIVKGGSRLWKQGIRDL